MLAVEAGLSWDEIGSTMTLPRLAAFSRYWDEVPPLGVTVLRIAQALGFEFRSATGAASNEGAGGPAVFDAARDLAAAGISVGGGR